MSSCQPGLHSETWPYEGARGGWLTELLLGLHNSDHVKFLFAGLDPLQVAPPQEDVFPVWMFSPEL